MSIRFSPIVGIEEGDLSPNADVRYGNMVLATWTSCMEEIISFEGERRRHSGGKGKMLQQQPP